MKKGSVKEHSTKKASHRVESNKTTLHHEIAKASKPNKNGKTMMICINLRLISLIKGLETILYIYTFHDPPHHHPVKYW